MGGETTYQIKLKDLATEEMKKIIAAQKAIESGTGDVRGEFKKLDESTKYLKKVQAQIKETEKDTLSFKAIWEQIDPTKMVSANLIAGGITSAMSGVVEFGKASLQEFQESAEGLARLEGVVKVAGSRFRYTAQELDSMASAMQDTLLIEDDMVRSSQAMLVTFGNIGGEAFPRTLQAAADTATVFGTMESATENLGKALNSFDGYTKLAKSTGMEFTKAEVAKINALEKTNDLMGYQNLLLQKVEQRFGGTAKAIADSTAGDFKRADLAVKNLQESFGGLIALPLAGVASGLSEIFNVLAGKTKSPAQMTVEQLTESINELKRSLDGLESSSGMAMQIAEAIRILENTQLAGEHSMTRVRDRGPGFGLGQKDVAVVDPEADARKLKAWRDESKALHDKYVQLTDIQQVELDIKNLEGRLAEKDNSPQTVASLQEALDAARRKRSGLVASQPVLPDFTGLLSAASAPNAGMEILNLKLRIGASLDEQEIDQKTAQAILTAERNAEQWSKEHPIEVLMMATLSIDKETAAEQLRELVEFTGQALSKASGLWKQYADQQAEAQVSAIDTKIEAIQAGVTESERQYQAELALRKAKGEETTAFEISSLEQLKRERIKAADQQAALEEKQKQIKLKNFNQGKAISIAQAVVSGSEAVMKTFGSFGWPLGVVPAGIMAALTAAEIGVIQAQVPALKDGGVVAAGSRYYELGDGNEREAVVPERLWNVFGLQSGKGGGDTYNIAINGIQFTSSEDLALNLVESITRLKRTGRIPRMQTSGAAGTQWEVV